MTVTHQTVARRLLIGDTGLQTHWSIGHAVHRIDALASHGRLDALLSFNCVSRERAAAGMGSFASAAE